MSSVATTVALFVPAVVIPASATPAQQTDLSISPFVSFLPASGASPLAGLALTLAGNAGLALRASGHLALESSNNSGFGATGTMRPWGADADALFFIGGRSFGGFTRTFAPFVFAGVGMSGSDSTGYNTTRNNWSYGAGATIPLGSTVDLFGESRWRMSRFVLPTAPLAPSPTAELRIGLSFHMGGSGGGSGLGDRAGAHPLDRRSEAAPASPIWPNGERYPTSTGTSANAARVIGTAEDYLGVPYRYGGTSPTSGFDCSGFTQYVFARQGVRLPRTSRQQAQIGMPVSPDWRAVAPGDLVMFEEGGRITHVAIYAGQNRIIHSSWSGGGVRYDDLTTRRGEWFFDHMVAARRVSPDALGLLLDLARGFADTAVQLDGPDHAPRPER
jgi:cell wall-associated NlpC family hydrolase